MGRLVSWMANVSFRRAGFVILAVLLLSGYGALTITRVDQELIPGIQFPLMVVVAQSPGSQPEQVVQNVVAPLEAATAAIDGLDATQSTAVAGLGVMLYQFEFGTDIDLAEQAIQKAIDALPLGDEVTTNILGFDPTLLPVVIFDLRGELDQGDLLRIAQTQVVPELSSLDGVGAVEVVGGAVDEILITLDRQQMLERGIAYEQVAAALQANNVVLPSGQVPVGQAFLPIETVAVLTSLDEIRAIGVHAADGSLVPLGELATIEEVEGTPVGISRSSGEPALSIRVTKEQDANTVAVADRVLSTLDDLAPSLPAGVSTAIFLNQAEFITDSIDSLINEGLIGGGLAIFIVLVFLANWRSTLVTAVSIPLSLVVGIIVLHHFGFSLNIMTLAGLTIAIGRVIDDSIVVLENIYRHMTQGEPTISAIVNGAREVAIAIIGATATTAAVFLPLAMVGGLIGELFMPFAVAVVASLFASLVVSVTVIPALARFLLVGRVRVRPDMRPGDTRLGRAYTPVLRWALNHRWTTLGISTLLFIGSLVLVPFLPVTFLPSTGENTIAVTVAAQPGQSPQAVLEQAIQVEEIIADTEALSYQTTITGASGDIGAVGAIISGGSPNSASISVRLPSSVNATSYAADLRERIAAELPESDNVAVSAAEHGFGSNVAITVTAASPQALAQLPDVAQQISEAVAAVDGTANVSSTLSAVAPTIEVQVDPARAAAVGLTPAQISSSLANVSSNQQITMLDLGQGPQPVRLRMTGVEADTLEALGNLEILPGVRLDEVATLEMAEKQVSITRVDGHQAATISADVTDENVGAVTVAIQTEIDKLEIPDGIEVLIGGVAGDIDEGFADMSVAIIASVVIVYAIMALLFQSWLDPFVILFTLPLAAIGAIVALFVTGSALSISSMIGVLMLVGIVVTNAIVMLEFVIMLRKERGYSLHDALIEGAQTRLRPILMTAFAAMLALIPLSLGLNEGLLIAADLGRVVIGGLFTSTMLTLLVIPVVYSLVDGLRQRFTRRESAAMEAALMSPSGGDGE